MPATKATRPAKRTMTAQKSSGSFETRPTLSARINENGTTKTHRSPLHMSPMLHAYAAERGLDSTSVASPCGSIRYLEMAPLSTVRSSAVPSGRLRT